MKTNKLINPFIIYWDINPSLSDKGIFLRVSDDILQTKIFVLNLRDDAPSLSKGTMAVLNRLNNEKIRIILTIQGNLAETDVLKKFGLRHIYNEIHSLNQLNTIIDRVGLSIEKGYNEGISFYISKNNFGDIPGVISLCFKHGIKDIKFPIQRTGHESIFYPGRDDVNRLRSEIRKLPIEEMKLVIHDPFLWELFHGRDNPNSAGCNGALSMMYISRDFDVTPCPVMPVSMGNLNSTTLKEIFSTDRRREIRESINRFPPECLKCDRFDICKAGCRGRSYVLHKSFDKSDPVCLFFH